MAVLDDLIRNSGLDYPAANPTGLAIHFTAAEHGNRTDVINNSLATVALVAGDVPVGAGTGGGRAIQVAAQSGVTSTPGGTLAAVSLINDTNFFATNAVNPPLVVAPAGEFNSPTYQIEIPTSEDR